MKKNIILLLLENSSTSELTTRAAEITQAALKESNLYKRFQMFKIARTYKVIARELKKYENTIQD